MPEDTVDDVRSPRVPAAARRRTAADMAASLPCCLDSAAVACVLPLSLLLFDKVELTLARVKQCAKWEEGGQRRGGRSLVWNRCALALFLEGVAARLAARPRDIIDWI